MIAQTNTIAPARKTTFTAVIVEEQFHPVAPKSIILRSLSLTSIAATCRKEDLPRPAVHYVSLHVTWAYALRPLILFCKVTKRQTAKDGQMAEMDLFPLRMPQTDLALLIQGLEEIHAPAPDPLPHGPCLVTGATGFIGRHLALRLAKSGMALRVLARKEASAARSFASFKNVEVIIGDIRQEATVRKIVKGMKTVFHCAALASDWGRAEDFYQTNVTGTRLLAEACLQESVHRLVHMSSTDAYGYPKYPEKNESLQIRKTGLFYADSKADAERAIRNAQEKGLRATILRPATVYGPGSYSIVREFADLIQKNDMVYIASGKANAGLCYVENLVDAVLLAATHPSAAGQAYDITDGVDVTWRDFTATLAKALGVPLPRLSIPFDLAYWAGWAMEHTRSSAAGRPLLTRTAVQLLGKSQNFSNAKAREELGYRPRFSFVEALAPTEEWLRRHD